MSVAVIESTQKQAPPPSGGFFVRAATGTALTAFLAAVVLWGPLWLFSLGTAGFIAAGLHEFYAMLKRKGVFVYRVFGVTIGLVIPFVVYLQLGQNRSGEVLFIVLACFCLFLLQFPRKDDPRALEGIALTFFGIMYVSWFMSFIIKLRLLDGGALFVPYVLCVAKAGDIAAYAAGTLFGRHTLMPHISPRKSVEGTLAGLAASAAVSLLFYAILPLEIGAIRLLLLGALLGLVGQCGDLSESLIKRTCGAKDSGRLFPGLGGALDVMDSVLFTVPLFYFYLLTVRP